MDTVRTSAPLRGTQRLEQDVDLSTMAPSLMKRELGNQLNISRTQSFGESNLPKTMRLANALRAVVAPELDEATKALPFPDRVYAWLAPSLRRDIALFHGGKGPSLSELFARHALGRLDEELRQELSEQIGILRPDVMAVLHELVSAEDDAEGSN